MKRIVSLLLTLVLALLLVGCGGKAAAGDSAAQSADSESGGYWNTAADADYNRTTLPRSRALRRTTTVRKSPSGPPSASIPAIWRCRPWILTPPAAASTRW